MGELISLIADVVSEISAVAWPLLALITLVTLLSMVHGLWTSPSTKRRFPWRHIIILVTATVLCYCVAHPMEIADWLRALLEV